MDIKFSSRDTLKGRSGNFTIYHVGHKDYAVRDRRTGELKGQAENLSTARSIANRLYTLENQEL